MDDNTSRHFPNIPIAFALIDVDTTKQDKHTYAFVFMNNLFKDIFSSSVHTLSDTQELEPYFNDHIKSYPKITALLDDVYTTANTRDYYHFFQDLELYIHFKLSKYNDKQMMLIALDKSESIENQLLDHRLNNQLILLRTALDAVPEMIAIKDLNGKYLMVNKAVDNYYSKEFDSIEGKTIEDIYPKKEVKRVKQLDNLAIERQHSIRKKVRVYTDNDYVVTDLTRAPIYNNSNELVGVISVGKDITKQEKSRKELLKTKKDLNLFAMKYEELAYTDDLTQVYNRRKFYKHLDALDVSKTHVLILTDLNNFKDVNDSKGHAYGDLTLAKFAKYLQKLFSPFEGLIFRLGGDEFGILYSDENTEYFKDNIEAVNAFLKEYHQKLSIAYGQIVIDNSTIKEKINRDLAIKRADKLLYDYKRQAKD